MKAPQLVKVATAEKLSAMKILHSLHTMMKRPKLIDLPLEPNHLPPNPESIEFSDPEKFDYIASTRVQPHNTERDSTCVWGVKPTPKNLAINL